MTEPQKPLIDLTDTPLPPVPVTKRCRECGKIRPLKTGFFKHNQSRDGHRHVCISCTRAKYPKRRKRRPVPPVQSPPTKHEWIVIETELRNGDTLVQIAERRIKVEDIF